MTYKPTILTIALKPQCCVRLSSAIRNICIACVDAQDRASECPDIKNYK